MRTNTKGCDLRQMRAACGMAQKELADQLDVTVRTVQNWERNGSVPREIEEALQRICGDQRIAHAWMVDTEPTIHNGMVRKVVGFINERRYRDAIVWGERITQPENGAALRYSPPEQAFMEVLLGKAYGFVGRRNEADKKHENAEEVAGQYNGQKNRIDAPIWTRIYVEARNARLVYSVEDKKIQLNEMINQLQRLIGMLDMSTEGKVIYPHTKTKLHWNVLNAAMVQEKADERLAIDAVTAIVNVHGKDKVKYWMESDPDVIGALQYKEVSRILSRDVGIAGESGSEGGAKRTSSTQMAGR